MSRISDGNQLGPKELQTSFKEAYHAAIQNGHKIYQVEGGFKSMGAIRAVVEWIKTGGQVRRLSSTQIESMVNQFNAATACFKNINASRVASGDLISPSKKANALFQSRVNNKVINEETVVEARLQEAEARAKNYENPDWLQSKTVRGKIKEQLIESTENKITGLEKYKESQKPILDLVNEAWKSEYTPTDERIPSKVKFAETVKEVQYSIFDDKPTKTTERKLKEDGINTEYKPGYLEVSMEELAKSENPGFLRLESAFVKLVEPDASKRAEKTFIAAQGARALFTECLYEITEKVRKQEIAADQAPAALRALLLSKMSKEVTLTQNDVKEISERGELAYYNIPSSDIAAMKSGKTFEKSYQNYGYFNAGQHVMEVKYYLFGNDPARFEKDKGAYPNKADYSHFLQGLKNHFAYHQKQASQ